MPNYLTNEMIVSLSFLFFFSLSVKHNNGKRTQHVGNKKKHIARHLLKLKEHRM